MLGARFVVVVSVATAMSTLLAACGDSKSNQEDVIATGTVVVDETPGSLIPIDAASTPPLWFAASLRTMVETYDTIILGHVDRAEVRYPPASVHPNGYRVEKPPETVSAVTVLHVISAPRIRQDQQISFVQAGGATKDGTKFQVAGDLLVEVGQTYLMFLNDLSFSRGLDEFIGPPFGRFLVREDSIVMPNGWDGELGVGAVSGVTREEVLAARYSENPEVALAAYAKTNVEEAASRILAAIAEGPLPPPPTPVPSGDASPAPSDQPTLTPAAEAIAPSAAP